MENRCSLFLYTLIPLALLVIHPFPLRSEIDPDQIYSLTRPAFTCKFQDDMELLDRCLERDNREMFLHLINKGSCSENNSGIQVTVKSISKYKPSCVEVVPIGEKTRFWTFAFNLVGFVDNQLLPEIRSKHEDQPPPEDKSQTAVLDPYAYRSGKEWQDRAEKLIAERKIEVGMTKGQVIRAWGEPKSKESRLGKGGSLQIWYYDSGHQVVFQSDDKVAHIYIPQK